jgi:hypothetical protein
MGDNIKRPGRGGARHGARDAVWKTRTSQSSSSTHRDEVEESRAAPRALGGWPEISHRTLNRNSDGSACYALGKLRDILVFEETS